MYTDYLPLAKHRLNYSTSVIPMVYGVLAMVGQWDRKLTDIPLDLVDVSQAGCKKQIALSASASVISSLS